MPQQKIAGRLACLFICASALLIGCGGGGSGLNSPSVQRESSAFSPKLLPASFIDGGSALGLSAETQNRGSQTLVSLRASGAKGLKALYVELAYDPSRYSLAQAVPAGAMGEPADIISLAVPVSRGRLAYGQVLSNYNWKQGLDGDGVVASITFNNRPEPANRLASSAPAGNASKASLYIDDSDALNWRYSNQGDYDQNSETNLADLTPIGLHFGETSPGGAGQSWPETDALSQVDGDGNGEINIADITGIGANFGAHVQGWNIYGSADSADYPEGGNLIGSLEQSSATSAGAGERLLLSSQAQYPLSDYYWVKPSDGSSEGVASQMLTVEIPVVSGSIVDINPSGSGDQADPYKVYANQSFDLLAKDEKGNDISKSLNTVYTPSRDLGAPMGAGANTVVVPEGIDEDFSIGITYKGRPANPPSMYFHASSIVQGFTLYNPPQFGTGTLEDPYIVDTVTDYVFSVVDPTDGDVTNDPSTVYTVSSPAAGSMGAGVNVLNITDGFTGNFNVSASYNGVATEPAAIFMQVPMTEGLWILPDPADLDWTNVSGDGSAGNPYICAKSDGFNSDFSVEFGLLANSLPDGSGTPIDPSTLTWAADPPFTATFVLPGIFTVNQFTNGLIFAQDASSVLSNSLAVVSQTLPST